MSCGTGSGVGAPQSLVLKTKHNTLVSEMAQEKG